MATAGITAPIVQQSIPAWNEAGRPEDAKSGTFGFNIQTNNLEVRIGSRWLKLAMKKV